MNFLILRDFNEFYEFHSIYFELNEKKIIFNRVLTWQLTWRRRKSALPCGMSIRHHVASRRCLRVCMRVCVCVMREIKLSF